MKKRGKRTVKRWKLKGKIRKEEREKKKGLRGEGKVRKRVRLDFLCKCFYYY